MTETPGDGLLQTFFEQAEGFHANPSIFNDMAFDDTLLKFRHCSVD